MVLCRMCTSLLSGLIQKIAVPWCSYTAPSLWCCPSGRTPSRMSRNWELEKGTPAACSTLCSLSSQQCSFFSDHVNSSAGPSLAFSPPTSLMFGSWTRSYWTSLTWSSSMATMSPRCSFCSNPTRPGRGQSVFHFKRPLLLFASLAGCYWMFWTILAGVWLCVRTHVALLQSRSTSCRRSIPSSGLWATCHLTARRSWRFLSQSVSSGTSLFPVWCS